MINGKIVLSGVTIEFGIDENEEPQQAHYVLTDNNTKEIEALVCDAQSFMKALAIAVHYTGKPDWKKDYQDARSIIKKINWIPD